MMNIQTAIRVQVSQLLAQLVLQVLARATSAQGSVSDNVVNGVLTICASFLKSSEADTVDLSVEVKAVRGCVFVSADLVRGGSGEIFSEIGPVENRNDKDVEVTIRTLEEYVWGQVDVIIFEMQKLE